jgi:hypothetical protein
MCNLLQRLPSALPGLGIGEEEARTLVGDAKRERSARLGDPHVLAHMDPPTPEIAAEWIGLKASVNQNLLHPDLSPFATEAERRVIAWLAPFFGMAEGHMCAGSTIANLAALWCAREHGASRVIASADAHLSVPKAAHLLGMPFEALPVDQVLPALGETALRTMINGEPWIRHVAANVHADLPAVWERIEAALAKALEGKQDARPTTKQRQLIKSRRCRTRSPGLGRLTWCSRPTAASLAP